MEGSAAAFSTPGEHGYRNDGVRHAGAETIEAIPTKARGYAQHMGEWGGEEELELDYEDEGDEWEDGEIRDVEVSAFKKGGGRGRKSGATSSSAFVFQDTFVPEGPAGGRQAMLRGRTLKRVPRNLGENVGEHSAGLNMIAPSAGAVIQSSNVPPSPSPQSSGERQEGGDHMALLHQRGPTPVRLEVLLPWLRIYPEADKARLLEWGFLEGFRIGYQGPRERRWADNLRSAKERPQVVHDKLAKKVALGRIAETFFEWPIDDISFGSGTQKSTGRVSFDSSPVMA
ncbi:hypothetical protein NDU88_010315 [Pleurodeles waltl]|uniref:Uncharacterized protein n=1 Tax=Pleurodeles waltl TaxID=8319 RepID=A0AAV7S2Y8_PLEWA|nr:hypothetical protein NDU88_010315 [Pleurodeles waltl]